MQGLSDAWFARRWVWVALLLVLIAPFSQAAYDGPTFVIDPQLPEAEDSNGDYHFHSLQAALDPDNSPHIQPNDLVILKPGTYAGPFVIDVPGITLRSEKGQALTTLNGTVLVEAKQVTLQGLRVQADGVNRGVTVRGPNVQLLDVRVSGASAEGLLLERAAQTTLRGVEASNNGIGLRLLGANGVTIEQSQFRANAGHGIILQDSSRFTLREGELASNGSSGIRFEGVNEANLESNRFEGNAAHGAELLNSANVRIARSTLGSNTGFGVVVEDSSHNIIDGNRISNNGGEDLRSGGVLIVGSSSENTVLGNDLTGHTSLDAAGVLLRGSGVGNKVIQNTVAGNKWGIRLEKVDGERPRANEITDNRVRASHEAGVYSSGEGNRYEDNVLDSNNGPGLSFEESDGESVISNTLTNNGTAGLWIDASRNLHFKGNDFVSNVNGIVSRNIVNSEWENNKVNNNHGRGIEIVNGNDLDFGGNQLEANRSGGLYLESVQQISLAENTVKANLGAGIQLKDAMAVQAHRNTVSENLGGWAIEGGRGFTIQFNDIEGNQGFGLSVSEAESFNARFNYWGRGEGPSGLTPVDVSEGDLVKGAEFDRVFPWLPISASRVDERTVRGWFFENTPGPQSVQVPQPNVSLELGQVEASRGWITVLTSKEQLAATPPGNQLASFNTYAGGQVRGRVRLSTGFDLEALPEGASVEGLHLYRWDGQAWLEVPSSIQMQANKVLAELSVADLDGATFALTWMEPSEMLSQRQQAVDSVQGTQSAWIKPREFWVVGEALEIRLRDSDKNASVDTIDTISRSVRLVDEAGQSVIAFDAVETAADTGLFELSWPRDAQLTFSGGETLRLRYIDPEDPTDVSETTLAVRGREPFALDPSAGQGEDDDGDFVYRSLAAALAGVPSPQPGETVRLLAGTYEGDWSVDVPGLELRAEAGAVLRGALTVRAGGVIVSGLAMNSPYADARVEGDGVRFERVTLEGGLTVAGDDFQLSDSEMSATSPAITIRGGGARLTRNAIQGTPALVAHGVRVRAQRNWWGQASGPGDVQGVTQEDVFPWLLAPPNAAIEDGRVEGTTWSGHGPGEILSDMGQALLALDLSRLWASLQRLFGQGAETVPLDDRWSLRVLTSQEGKLIAVRDRHGLADWMPANTQRLGVWTDSTREMGLRLVFDGADRPRVWGAQDGGWTALEIVRAGSDRWRVNLPRPADAAPLWLAVSNP